MATLDERITRRRALQGLGGLAAVAGLGAGAVAAHAQSATYPSKLVTIVVPFGGGNAYDQMVRYLAERLQTATGQVSFGDPAQFRFESEGMPGTVPPSEVIFDGDTLYSRGRDTPYLPEDTWVTLQIKEGTIGSDMVLRQYGDSMLVLVTPLGVTSAEQAEDDAAGTRYVTQVDVSAARQHVSESLLPAYDARMANLSSAGVSPTHEVEVWVDSDGRIARTRYVQELQGQNVDAIVVTYDFDGYGEPMEAAPPSGAEVLTLEEAQERRQAAETPKPS